MSINYSNRSHWSFFPSITPLNGRNNFRQLNIIKGKSTIKDLIIHYLLLRKGEHPLYPELGLPDYIFKPVAEIGQNAFAEMIKKEILSLNKQFNWGIADVITTAIPEYLTRDDYYASDQPIANEYCKTFYVSIELEYEIKQVRDLLQVNYQTLARDTEELILGL